MIKRFRHAQLLAALTLLLLLNPFVESVMGFALVDILLLITLLSAVLACANRRINVIIGLVLTATVQLLIWYRSYHEIEAVTVLYTSITLLFLLYVTSLVLSNVFRSREVSSDTICGAIAAYLLIGLTWAFAYALLDSVVPGSIVGLRSSEGLSGYDEYLSYSFVTLTTLGYGNVVPGNARADTLATMEAVVGQVYLTVLVARLVAMNLAFARVERREGEDLGDR